MILGESLGRSSKSHSETKVSRHMFGSPSPCAFVCKGNVREESRKDSYDIKWTFQSVSSTGNHKQPLNRSNHRHKQRINQPQVFTCNHRQSLTQATTGKHRQPVQKPRATSGNQLTNHKHPHATTSNHSTLAATGNDRQPLIQKRE